MRIHATTTGSKVELTAKEKRDLQHGLDVCRLLSAHTDSEEASAASQTLEKLVTDFGVKASETEKTLIPDG